MSNKPMMNEWYVYVDHTVDDDVPFYVGKGNAVRVRGLERNADHTFISTVFGVIREIVIATSVEQLSFDNEIRLITELHTFIDDPEYNGIGCNLTPGGEGHSPSLQERHRRSARFKALWSNSAKREKWCAAFKGKNGVHKSELWRSIKSKAMTGKGNHNFGMHLPEETKKISEAKKGVPSKQKGVRADPGTVAKRMKQIVITDASGLSRMFSSFKEAAETLAHELELSSNTVITHFVARRKMYHGLKLEYPGDK